MLTTIPNSNTLRLHKTVIGFLLLLLMWGCQTVPKAEEFFKISPEMGKQKALQTRFFETTDEKELLSASAAVLQDLGFQVEESATEVGLLCAAKERGAREYGQEILQVFLFTVMAGLSGKAFLMPVDLHQQINANLVTCRSEADPSRFAVRIQFYRKIWKGEGDSGDSHIPPGLMRMEMNYDERIYQQFFAKLSKSLFLEAHKI